MDLSPSYSWVSARRDRRRIQGRARVHDPTFLRWMQDSLTGRTPHIDRIGISYMYPGAWKPAKDGSSGHAFHVGLHLMVVGPNPDEFQGFNRDGTNGMPYVTHLANRTELFLVMPVRQWNE